LRAPGERAAAGAFRRRQLPLLYRTIHFARLPDLAARTEQAELMNPDANVATSRFTPTSEGSSGPQPPAARRHPVEHVIHGDRRIDDYAWLRNKNDPAVIAYLNAENAYTDSVLRDTEPLQEKLYQEMLGRILQTDLSVPYRLRGYLYFTCTEEGKQYPIHGRRRWITLFFCHRWDYETESAATS
jgi:hypothetical protein